MSSRRSLRDERSSREQDRETWKLLRQNGWLGGDFLSRQCITMLRDKRKKEKDAVNRTTITRRSELNGRFLRDKFHSFARKNAEFREEPSVGRTKKSKNGNQRLVAEVINSSPTILQTMFVPTLSFQQDARVAAARVESVYRFFRPKYG